MFRDAYGFVRELSGQGGLMLFVGTKKQAQDAISRGGRALRDVLRHQSLAWWHAHNFQTIKQSIDRLRKLDETLESEASLEASPERDDHDPPRARQADGVRSAVSAT